ncbi:hypothetical protein [Enterococcus thailandicus]|uniref:hypothetical protein n=1 Tax=Enterococcus thailandicus TaxID=417368 RepID=UPI0022E701A0|nr:hypothetical protein [Enterococcus thailandicus]
MAKKGIKEHGYVVKKSVYQGSDGVQVDSSKEASLFTSYQEAKLVADNTGGRPIKVLRKSRLYNQEWMKHL